YKEQYREMRATARLGFDKMKKAGKAERKALSASRAELNHALSLPTNFNVPIESGVAFTWPETIPSEKELIRNMPFRRIDFIALQGGIAEKNPELMNYILSRFNAINVSLMADTKAQWLVAGAPGVYITFPLFGANHGVADMRATNDELLTKNYKNRLKVATLQVSRLSNGLAFIIGELQRIDSILPAVTQDAREHADKKSPVMALQKQKTLLAVRLLRLRLLRKLMDTGFALEIASGTRIFETHLISDTPSTLQGKKSK
ncbi:MAG: hypothetical protein ACE5DR_01190, partial [Thermodesulfobacteriota bacterium]